MLICEEYTYDSTCAPCQKDKEKICYVFY